MTDKNSAYDINTNTDLEDQLVRLEKKLDLLLDQHKATQKAIAHIKGDIPDIVKSALNKRAIQGYSRIMAG